MTIPDRTSITEADWTTDPETGRSNSSPLFKSLCAEVERLIRGDAHKLISGRADMTAGLIMAQLAHVHHLAPSGETREWDEAERQPLDPFPVRHHPGPRSEPVIIDARGNGEQESET